MAEVVAHAQLLNVLACPVCGSRLLVDPVHKMMVCRIDHLGYVYRGSTVDMRVENAILLDKGGHS